MFDAYKKLSGSDIEDSIEGETTGNLENLLLAVGKTCDLSGSYLTHHKYKEWGSLGGFISDMQITLDSRNQSQYNVRLT